MLAHPTSQSLPPVTEELLRALPKTDLHCHLDGSLRLETILDLADKNGVRLPADNPKDLARAIHMGEQCGSLKAYLEAFAVTLSVLQTEEALSRVAYELAVDATRENVRYLEVRYSPVLHTETGLKPTAIIDAVLDGLRRAKREIGIKSNVIICASARSTQPLRSAWRSCRWLTRTKGWSASTWQELKKGIPPRHTRRPSSSS